MKKISFEMKRIHI